MDLNLGMGLPGGGQPEAYDVIIIGGGPAGTSAAIYTSRSNLRTLVIDKGPDRGRSRGNRQNQQLSGHRRTHQRRRAGGNDAHAGGIVRR